MSQLISRVRMRLDELDRRRPSGLRRTTAPADDGETTPGRPASCRSRGRVHRVDGEAGEVGAHPDADAPGHALLAGREAGASV